MYRVVLLRFGEKVLPPFTPLPGPPAGPLGNRVPEHHKNTVKYMDWSNKGLPTEAQKLEVELPRASALRYVR